MIKVNDLHFRYEDEEDQGKYALHNINLEVKKGEFVCIIGQNGSGKSTLSKLINAMFPPTRGKVFVGGLDTSDPEVLWDIRRQAGMVFQNPDNQMVATIVEEDVAFGAENLGIPSEEIRRRVDAALRAVGMYEFRFQSPEQLSGGQKQRVAIAGILAMQPSCIVFDESTAMLDPSGRHEVMEVIRDLHEKGMTVLLVTHHMDEAVRADKVFVMEKGRIVMEGTPAEIFRVPDQLKALGLDIPFSVFASLKLRDKGAKIGICLTPEQLVSELGRCRNSARHFTDRADIACTAHTEDDIESAGAEHCIEVDRAATEREKLVPHASEAMRTGGAELPVDLAISVRSLSHVYEYRSAAAVAAVTDVNLDIKKGEIVGIIGHTGSGKSTFVQHINGLLSPTEGRITVSDLEITRDAASGKRKSRKELLEQRRNVLEIRRRVGLVFQYPEYQLFEETVEKDIMFGPLNLGLTEAEALQRVKRSMKLVGLDYETFAKLSPFELSGGQKRRVAIAGVLAMEPEVLILDEPTAGLDPRGRDEILDEIGRLHSQRNTTILVVSHSMDDMAAFAERIVVFSEGRLILDGTPKEVFSRYDLLKSVGLDVPEVTKTLRLLKKEGYDVDLSVIRAEEGVEEMLKAGAVC